MIMHLSILKAKKLIVARTLLTEESACGLIGDFKGKDLINNKISFDYLATLVIHDKLGNVIKELTPKKIITL